MYEQLLFSIKKHFNKTTRTSAELKDKLQQLFEDNIADYNKFANWYDPGKPQINISGKDEFEHYLIEDFKKSVYGDSYEIKEHKPFY
jgi:hypothetical protein